MTDPWAVALAFALVCLLSLAVLAGLSGVSERIQDRKRALEDALERIEYGRRQSEEDRDARLYAHLDAIHDEQTFQALAAANRTRAAARQKQARARVRLRAARTRRAL